MKIQANRHSWGILFEFDLDLRDYTKEIIDDEHLWREIAAKIWIKVNDVASEYSELVMAECMYRVEQEEAEEDENED